MSTESKTDVTGVASHALLAPFVAVAKGIPENWPGECILRFDQRNDGSIYLSYHGINDASHGITINQWRALLGANDQRQATAAEIVAALLANPYPHDLMAIRREVEREWGDEEVAREEMDAYCTHEAMMEARRKWTAAQDAGHEWLSSQNDPTLPTEGAATDS
jgi:hypothetical protein